MNGHCLIALLLTIGISLAIPAKEYHIESRIVGGSESTPHQFPYLVAIYYEGSLDCGGTILSERWILTAGHCIAEKSVEDIEILAGKHDLSVEEEGQQKRMPEKFIVHPGARLDMPAPDDIGLIYLREPLMFSETVAPIALPKEEIIPTGDGIVAGWGSTSYTVFADFPDRVQFGIVSILDYQTCMLRLKAIGGGILFDETNICSGSYKQQIGHCGGDSGGPLVQENEGKTTIVGVISFAYIPCGDEEKGFPAFGRVSHYISWLKENMQ